jgi:hypothetical protein
VQGRCYVSLIMLCYGHTLSIIMGSADVGYKITIHISNYII